MMNLELQRQHMRSCLDGGLTQSCCDIPARRPVLDSTWAEVGIKAGSKGGVPVDFEEDAIKLFDRFREDGVA